MVNVLASVTVKEGKVQEFLAIFKSNVPEVKKEKGCIEYFPAMDVDAGIPVQSWTGTWSSSSKNGRASTHCSPISHHPIWRPTGKRSRASWRGVSIKILQEV